MEYFEISFGLKEIWSISLYLTIAACIVNITWSTKATIQMFTHKNWPISGVSAKFFFSAIGISLVSINNIGDAHAIYSIFIQVLLLYSQAIGIYVYYSDFNSRLHKMLTLYSNIEIAYPLVKLYKEDKEKAIAIIDQINNS